MSQYQHTRAARIPVFHLASPLGKVISVSLGVTLEMCFLTESKDRTAGSSTTNSKQEASATSSSL
eukprot:CAMPEP_0175886148 /NCGR_PEP_ID=MMETSP0107_2-20121207/45472_1 /TAXON_ID=195067 ORGANISM="Goniomonas pacifica, Strain CCMP1869" /NCGR_SAMPLE_ID=MMETSP0107_2 /ASSEMBLY_ACC=CAM_ASM_000203 /LENGTH=64 /DNA_ID=CAMNT_0017206491 /DNA_START=58 /DNA_END=252 /DNA_ORIENTATION=-